MRIAEAGRPPRSLLERLDEIPPGYQRAEHGGPPEAFLRKRR